MRRWIAKTSAEGPGGYWCLYEGDVPGARTLVATVCKFVTRWRGYVHELRSDDGLYHLVPKRSPSQASAQEAAQWVVEQLAAQRGIA